MFLARGAQKDNLMADDCNTSPNGNWGGHLLLSLCLRILHLADVYLVSSFGARHLGVMEEDSVYPVWCRLGMRPMCSQEISAPNGCQERYFQREKMR